ncbi:MAG TPA: hypothetical protein VFC19_25935 [Candidatus Limnocylindrales bacterium]|nr:hypothetical protein [Candidatus Limnocylindrales bacterium]
MTIKLVLDSSAALSYSMGAPQVGEALGELLEEPGWRFAVPAVCLAEAGAITDDGDLLMRLGHHARGVVTPVPAKRWRQLVSLSRLLGSPKWALPFLLATANDAYLLTATPERYPDSDRVIDVSRERP